MTFTEIQTEILDRLNLTSSTDSTRIGRAINRVYREVTSTVGLQLSRRTTSIVTATIGVSTITVSNCENIISVINRAVSPYKVLDEVSLDELREDQPYAASDSPTKWAINSITSDTHVIEINVIPQTAIDLYVEKMAVVADLSGANEPAFPESYHDILIYGVLIDEYDKVEKPTLSVKMERRYEKRLGELRLWIALGGPYKDIYQGKMKDGATSGGSGGSSSGDFPGSLSGTQTGLITYDRDPLPPFAVSSGSAKVDNLDADLLDGLDSTAFAILSSANAFSGANTHSGAETFSNASPLTLSNASAVLTFSGVTAPEILFSGIATTVAGLISSNGSVTINIDKDNDGTTSLFKVRANNTTDIFSMDETGIISGIGGLVLNDNVIAYFGTGQDAALYYDGTNLNLNTANVGSGVLNLVAGKIKFPAAQSASSDVNTLDDYEEGTWTPIIVSAGGGTATYGSQVASYIKVGRVVHVQGSMSLATKGTLAAGAASIGGLPFAAQSTANNYSQMSIPYFSGMTTSIIGIGGFIDANATQATLVHTTAAATGITNTQISDLGANVTFIFSASYRAAN